MLLYACFYFSEMLKLGSSVPWTEAMEVITGQKKMDASALIDYFEPLVDWLKTENKNKNYSIGWESACPVSQIPNQVRSEQDRAKTWLEEYNNLAEKAMYKEYEAEWTYTSNITDENQAKQVSLTGVYYYMYDLKYETINSACSVIKLYINFNHNPQRKNL